MRNLLSGCIASSLLSLLTCGAQPGAQLVSKNGQSNPGGAPSAKSSSGPPRVLFTDVESGPVTGGPKNLGVPISIFGKGFGTERGTSRVTIGGNEVAAYLVWGTRNAHNKALDMIVVQPGTKVTGGPIVVTVNDQTSNADYSFLANSGHVFYVATGGTDNRSCSLNGPCATVLNAVSVMAPGDTILVRGGTYSEGEIWIRAAQSGAAGQAKVIKNYPGEEVYLTNKVRDVLVDADYITVSGLNFQNGKSLYGTGWASSSQQGLKFINNTFIGTIGYAAIEITGNQHVLAGNLCEISGSSVGTMGHCYYITQGSDLKILYNVASGAPGYGLHVYDERRSANDFRRIISNVLVEGNLLKGSTQRSGMIVAMTDGGGYGNVIDKVTIRNNVFAANNHLGLLISGSCRNLQIYNNTFYQNGRQAIYIESDPHVDGVDIRSNLLYEPPNPNCKVDCGNVGRAHIQLGTAARNVLLTHNLYHPGPPVIIGSKDSNPVLGPVEFVDAAAFDFHVRRGAAAGIGAYEVSQGSAAAPPRP